MTRIAATETRDLIKVKQVTHDKLLLNRFSAIIPVRLLVHFEPQFL
jgi:hypothetical protein